MHACKSKPGSRWTISSKRRTTDGPEQSEQRIEFMAGPGLVLLAVDVVALVCSALTVMLTASWPCTS